MCLISSTLKKYLLSFLTETCTMMMSTSRGKREQWEMAHYRAKIWEMFSEQSFNFRTFAPKKQIHVPNTFRCNDVFRWSEGNISWNAVRSHWSISQVLSHISWFWSAPQGPRSLSHGRVMPRCGGSLWLRGLWLCQGDGGKGSSFSSPNGWANRSETSIQLWSESMNHSSYSPNFTKQ